MARKPSRGRSRQDRGDLYQEITDRIIAELEQGCVPWVQPWGCAGAGAVGMPQNAVTERRYSGINVLILWGAVVEHGFGAQHWLTFRQALGQGGNVRKGERGTTIFYADRFVPDDERARARDAGEEPRAVPFLKRFTVFNTEQCDGLPDAPPSLSALDLDPMLRGLIVTSGADFRIGGDRAYYDVIGNFIRVPPPSAFFDPVNWHRTALHELGHWTGAATRLKRDMTGYRDPETYAREELVAEMTAAFSCAALGIAPTVRHADYIGHWLTLLSGDKRAIFRAASAASKAADYLLSFARNAGALPRP